MNQRRRSGRKRNGLLVVLFALLLPVLIVVLGFSIDYANMQRVRNEARAVADIAAKVAADTLAVTDDIEAARLAAIDIAAQNTIAGESVVLESGNIQFGRAVKQEDGSYSFDLDATPYNSVRVVSERSSSVSQGPIDLFFGRFYGRPSFDVSHAATSSFINVDICLVLDRSGSMKYQAVGTTVDYASTRQCVPPLPDSRWAELNTAVEAFVSRLEQTNIEERVAMVTFSSDTTICTPGITLTASSLDQPLTTNMADIRNQMAVMSSTVWGGGTNVTAGLDLARLHMTSASDPDARRFIIVLTDGIHNDGLPPFASALLAAQDGYIVHTITFSDDANLEDMQTVAFNGGGTHHHAANGAELENVFRRIAGSFAILTD
ncbi:MAG: vWA domain-containing protein [Planctomycetota bacterium]